MEARTLGLLYSVDPVVGEQNFPQFVVIHTVKGFSIVNEAEVGVFLEFSYKMCIYNMCILNFRASLLAQLVKNLPATQEIQLDSLVG